MSVIATKENQINVYTCNEDSLTKKVIAFAHATKAVLHVIDICKTKLTGTEWAELASKANLTTADFIQTEHPIYKKTYTNNSVVLDDESAIKILHSHPEVLVYPIALRTNKAVLCKTESDLLQLQSSDTGEVPIP